MSLISPSRHPLLHSVSDGAQWAGTDNDPSPHLYAEAYERWLRLLDRKGILLGYLPSLRESKEKRDEAFAKIAVAHFLEERCGLSVAAWEVPDAGAEKLDFLVTDADSTEMLVQVTSPGWQAEIADAEGQKRLRLQLPHLGVRHAVKKAYPTLVGGRPTLLIVNDERMVGPYWLEPVRFAVYSSPKEKVKLDTGYFPEDGCFAGTQYDLLGAVGFLSVTLGRWWPFTYQFTLFENPNAQAGVAVPKAFFRGFRREHGG